MNLKASITAVVGVTTVLAIGACGMNATADTSASPPVQEPNQMVGTWRMMSAVSDPGGPGERRPYGNKPNGMAVFNANGTFLEVFQNTEIPAFTNNERVGNAEENAAVVGGTIGQYGTYTVDENGAFESDIITGSTWPNRNGVQYRTPELTLTVNGDQLTEVLASPGRPMLRIEFVRVP